jgi:hypothetical protein
MEQTYQQQQPKRPQWMSLQVWKLLESIEPNPASKQPIRNTDASAEVQP